MKYTVSTEINAPMEKVVELFDNPDNYKYWQKGLQSIKYLEGKPCHPGAKSELTFLIGKKNMVITEVVKTRNLPEEYETTFNTDLMFNVVKTRIKSKDANTTLFITDQEINCIGWFKLTGWLFPKMFKKQSAKYLADFKEFVENYSVDINPDPN